jgi:hypothetical protein
MLLLVFIGSPRFHFVKNVQTGGKIARLRQARRAGGRQPRHQPVPEESFPPPQQLSE